LQKTNFVARQTMIKVLEKIVELHKRRGSKASKLIIEAIDNELDNENELVFNIIVDSVCQSFKIYKNFLINNSHIRRTSQAVEAIAICCVFLCKYWTTNITAISQKIGMDGECNRGYIRKLIKKYNKEQLEIYSQIPLYAELLSKYNDAENKINEKLKKQKLKYNSENNQ